MATFTATITVPISIELPTTETTEQGLSNFIYKTLEPLLRKLEVTDEWEVGNWGWTDLWYDNKKKTHIVYIEGLLNTTKRMDAEHVLEVFDFFTENYTIPRIDLGEAFEQPEKFFVSEITDDKNIWSYDDRGFITYASEWKSHN